MEMDRPNAIESLDHPPTVRLSQLILATSPLEASVEAAAAERDGAGVVGGGRGQILLVEDDRSIRVALQGILEDEGYGVATAENGRQALERLRAGAAPDLIVLDLGCRSWTAGSSARPRREIRCWRASRSWRCRRTEAP